MCRPAHEPLCAALRCCHMAQAQHRATAGARQQQLLPQTRQLKAGVSDSSWSTRALSSARMVQSKQNNAGRIAFLKASKFSQLLRAAMGKVGGQPLPAAKRRAAEPQS